MTAKELCEAIVMLIGFGNECGTPFTFNEYYQISATEIKCNVSNGDDSKTLFVQCYSKDPKAFGNTNLVSQNEANEFDCIERHWAVKIRPETKSFTIYVNDDGTYYPTLSAHVSYIPTIIKLLQNVFDKAN